MKYLPRDIPSSRTKLQLTDANRELLIKISDDLYIQHGVRPSESLLINLLLAVQLEPTGDTQWQHERKTQSVI